MCNFNYIFTCRSPKISDIISGGLQMCAQNCGVQAAPQPGLRSRLRLAARLELLHGAAVVLSLLGHRDGHRALGLRLKFLQGLCFLGLRLRLGRPVSVSVAVLLAGLAVVRVTV